MKNVSAILLILIPLIYFGQSKCAEVNTSNAKLAWTLANYTFKKYKAKEIPSKEDMNLYLCLMKKLDSIGDKRATSFLAQGFLYGLEIFGGENLNEAEIYLSKLFYETDYAAIQLSKKNLNTCILNLYSNKEAKEKKMVEVFEIRAKKFQDEYSLNHLGNFYRYRKGKEKISILNYRKSCEYGNKVSCELIDQYEKSPKAFFTVRSYAPPPPLPTN